MPTKSAVVEVKLGRDAAGLCVVRATARENHAEVDEFGVRKNINGRVIAGFDMTVEKPEEWRARKGGFGKLYFHALKELKARLEMSTKCKVCDQGEVRFRKLREGLYVAKWVQVRFAERGVCHECWQWLHPLRNHFNPHPELDDDGKSYENIFCDCVTEPHRVSREALDEDLEYWAAIDAEETRKFLGSGTDECIDEHSMWVLSQGPE